MDKLVAALGPVFAVGFAVQQLIELLSPVVDKAGWRKKEVLGLASLVIGIILAWGAGIRVLAPLGVRSPHVVDIVISGLIVSAGTEGVNSIMKFLGYAKEKKRAESKLS